MKKIFIVIISLFFLLIGGCSSLETAVKKRNIETQTKMSETIWLNPEYITDKTIFVQVKNTSMTDISIERDLKNVLAEKGYKVVNTPKTANYWLQINILKLEKLSLNTSDAALSGLTGAGIGALLGGYNTGSANTAVAWGLVGGALGILSDALVDDTFYGMITDILVSERTPYKVKSSAVSATTQGTHSRNFSVSENSGNMNKYQTRVVSTANKMNLKLEEAEPVLKRELLKAVSNIF